MARSLDDTVSEAAEGAIRQYVASDQFKDRAEEVYSQAIRRVVDEARTRVRNTAFYVGILVFGLFSAIALLQYAQIRETEAEVHIQYAEALKLVEEIRKTVEDLKASVDTRTKEVAATLDETEADVSVLEAKLIDADNRTEEISSETSSALQEIQESIGALELRLTELQNLASEIESQIPDQ